ncbi:sporulation protein YqfD [Bacillus badius]|uniref:Stage IV sporulation protein n=1 Tax=Bacillus badius TaxID=1455 RepID=A0ABR5AY81_BACBA|nr:sporulation protein YqfD [Bacillus badius]KIL79663.1 Stage IV sporulation protein [Bacillus badius]KZR60471.1 stage IV sporulation protein [Bacillus badius]MED0664706.1 sporulation protein YqfD [Bacillus badius]MED4715239.1 sporulation protein YqfD [Bacillus badius]UAT29597.1 sporulation protein YqfD [Bacillus badius]
MNNQWLAFFQGIIFVKVQGQGAERLINRLLRSGIPIWNVSKQGEQAILFSCSLQHIHKVRRAARTFEGDLHFYRGEGFPFLLKRLWRSSGFLVGAAAFLVVVLLLSNIVWRIDIGGASPKMEHQIRKELAGMGIEKGKFIFSADDPETVQHKLLNRIEGLTWVGVEVRGSTFHFRVVEKTAPKEKKVKGPRHLVAAKEAVIAKLFVKKGQAAVKRDQFVHKGQLLVSGFIGTEDRLKEVAADGEVWAETWYKAKVEMPVSTEFQVLTGRQVKKHRLEAGSFKLPVWGFKNHSFADYKKDEQLHSISFLGMKLPVSYAETTYYESKQTSRSYTEKEAELRALDIARGDLEAKLPEKAEIRGEKILQRQFTNGKVKLSIHFQVLENIAVEKPITQGDKKNARRKKHNEYPARKSE